MKILLTNSAIWKEAGAKDVILTGVLHKNYNYFRAPFSKKASAPKKA